MSAFAAARCIDQYVEQRVKALEEGKEPEIDERLTAIVERMFDRRAGPIHDLFLGPCYIDCTGTLAA